MGLEGKPRKFRTPTRRVPRGDDSCQYSMLRDAAIEDEPEDGRHPGPAAHSGSAQGALGEMTERHAKLLKRFSSLLTETIRKNRFVCKNPAVTPFND